METIQSYSRLFVSLAVCLLPIASAQTGSTQNVTLSGNVQIPGAELKAGAYTFSVEDKLSDRAIVRITSTQDTAEHYLLLTVPNSKLSDSSADHLMMYKAGSDNAAQALRAWKCSTCSAPLEFVYPKLEAVKLTDASTLPVLAVDPTYDKLPGNLSADDMKVVTLWLLSPERITADNVGEGVKAAKYASVSNPSSDSATQEASAAPPASAPTADTASVTNRRQLPKTASYTYLYALLGFLCLGGAFSLRIKRQLGS